MNTCPEVAATPSAPSLQETPAINLVVLGCGQVGSVLLQLLQEQVFPSLRLCGVANSRVMACVPEGVHESKFDKALECATRDTDVDALLSEVHERGDGQLVVVDATACPKVAARHQQWLARGVPVVTANKLAAANGVNSFFGNSFYGDSATVGAGLPVLQTLRRLRAAGDRIKRVEGILSGSLAYLFHAMEGGTSFKKALARAQRLGYTEPDPLVDLRGDDVRCKLAILAHAAGFDDVCIAPAESVAGQPDDWWCAQLEAARDQRRVLRYVATLDAEQGTVGPRAISADSPLAQTRETENLVAIYSGSYDIHPLVIRGPGAGPEVTARALLSDLAEAARIAGRQWQAPLRH